MIQALMFEFMIIWLGYLSLQFLKRPWGTENTKDKIIDMKNKLLDLQVCLFLNMALVVLSPFAYDKVLTGISISMVWSVNFLVRKENYRVTERYITTLEDLHDSETNHAQIKTEIMNHSVTAS